MMTLAKYHGLGNDFLVLLALEPMVAEAAGDLAELARKVCDRHRGFGADGLLIALPAPDSAGAVASMVLHNADGSRAEMSGNGIRCFVHGLLDGGVAGPGLVTVATDAGLRAVDASGPDRNGLAMMRVGMGTARVEAAGLVEGAASLHVDVGNPHLVVGMDVLPDIAQFGPRIEAGYLPIGINVEAVRMVDDGRIEMVVWERGVGVTQACGTGAVASAAAARCWGLVGERVTVAQPGGEAIVEMSGSMHAPGVTLVGPSQRIGRCEVA